MYLAVTIYSERYNAGTNDDKDGNANNGHQWSRNTLSELIRLAENRSSFQRVIYEVTNAPPARHDKTGHIKGSVYE